MTAKRFEEMFPSLAHAEAFTVGGKRFVSLEKVLEIIDSSIKDVESLTTGREGAISEERKEGMLLEARAIRACAENLKGVDQE